MFFNTDIGIYIANDRSNRFALAADSKDFQVWNDIPAGRYYCRDKRIETDRAVWNEVVYEGAIIKDKWENTNFPEEVYESIANCEVSGEYTYDGITYIRWFRFKHVYNIFAYVKSAAFDRDTTEKQKKKIQEYCNKYMPYASISWITDEDCSEILAEREGYQEVIDNVFENEYIALIVSDLSRISHNDITLFKELERLLSFDVRIISVDDDIDSISPIWYDVNALERIDEKSDYGEVARKIIIARKNRPKKY